MPEGIEVIEPGKRRVTNKTAKRMVELVEQGKPPKEAARLLDIDLKDPDNWAIVDQVRGLLRDYAAKPELDRELVRATRRKAMLESLRPDATDEGPNFDIALKAANQIASDPEVGLTAAPQPVVSINIGTLEKIIEGIKMEDVIDIRPTEDRSESEVEDQTA